MYDIHKEIINFSKKNFLRILNIESKVLELVTIHITEYIKSFQNNHIGNNLLPHEIENLKKIPRLIDGNLNKKYKIEWFAKEIGMNINKFQKGFQELYKVTVNKYIQKLRLKKAEQLLKETHLTISEIVDQLGLSSKSHFSKIFKEHYLITPSEFRRKQRNQPLKKETL